MPNLKRRRNTNTFTPRKRHKVMTRADLGIENKFVDSFRNANLVSGTTWADAEVDPITADSCSSIAQGDGQSQRDGRRCSLTSWHVIGTIEHPIQTNQTVTDSEIGVFIAFVLDTQTNNAQLNAEDVYVLGGASAFIAASPLRNLAFGKRFQILGTKRLTLKAPIPVWDGTNLEMSGTLVNFEFFKTFKKPILVTFNLTTAVITAVATNSLHVIAICTSVTGTPAIHYASRVRFFG